MVTTDDKRPGGDGSGAPARSRTTLVMDHLLSRGPLLTGPATEATGRTGPSDPWTTVAPVFESTDPSLLAGHLAWLVSEDHHDGDRWSESQDEDQIRILVRALDERHQHDLLEGALEQTPPWPADAVTHDDEIIMAYASDLTAATGGFPEDSPYVALAVGAAQWVAGIIDHRGSPTAGRRPA